MVPARLRERLTWNDSKECSLLKEFSKTYFLISFFKLKDFFLIQLDEFCEEHGSELLLLTQSAWVGPGELENFHSKCEKYF